MYNNLKKLALLCGDILVLYASLYITLCVRYLGLPTEKLWNDHFSPFTILIIGWILIFYISNLYNLNIAANNLRFFQAVSKSLIVSGSLSLAFFYLMTGISIAPKRNLLIYIIVVAILFYLWRQLYNWSLKSYLPKVNIAFIGLNNQVRELISELELKPHLGFKVSFVFAPQENDLNIPFCEDASKLSELIESNKVTLLILALDPSESEQLRSSLFNCLNLKTSYISLPRFYETITGKVPIEAINQMWFLENLNEGNRFWFNLFKRIYDLIIASILFLTTVIFWPLIGIIIKLESKGKIFFTQTRAGKGGKPFTIIKFRTMNNENNNYAPTAVKDFRVTKFGSFLRKTRVDELPQIINILKGDMSFVGPRPERLEIIAELEKGIPFYRERMLVKPGATGWDQVSGEYHSPSREDTIKKLQYDLFYVKNRSIYLDLSIILKTISTVLSRSGR